MSHPVSCRNPRLAHAGHQQGVSQRPGARRAVRVFAQQSGTAIERADTRKGTLAHTVQESIISPFTAVPIAAGAVAGFYLYHQGVDGASLGRSQCFPYMG